MSPPAAFMPIALAREMVNGIALHRAGEGPPVVLLHGGSGSWRHFAANIGPLAESYKVIAVDLPGFGDSAAAPRDMDLDAYLAWIIEAVDRVAGSTSTLALAGFSVGGMMATALAARLDQRVRRLALFAVGGYRPDEIETLPLKGPRPGMSDDEIDAVHRHNLGVIMFADPAQIDARAIRIQRESVALSRFDSRRLGLNNHISLFLPRVTCPVMMIFGGRDSLTGRHTAARIALCRSLKPDAELHVLADVGHWVCYEGADRVNPLLLRFPASRTNSR